MSTHLLQPIAILRTPFAEKFGVPRQGALAPAAEGLVEFLPEFSAPEYVRGLEAFSHVWLITGFHHSPWTGSAVVRPPRLGGNERVGVFATRSANRPNGLGLTLVRLLAIEAGVLRVGGVDAVDGTPVFDVKPYLPWCESIPEAQSDWARDQPFAREEAAVHFAAGIAARLGEETATLVRQLLRLPLAPAYQDSAARDYGMTVAGWNIRWRAAPAAPDTIEVFAAERVTADDDRAGRSAAGGRPGS